MNDQFILAIDQGTTGTTAALLNENGSIFVEADENFPQHFPKPGYVEHYGHEIWRSVKEAIEKVLAKSAIKPSHIAAIGVTNQRETTCLFDQEGKAASPFIVWQCRRTEPICQRLREQGLSNLVHRRTGLLLDPYFSATKIMWLFEQDPSLKEKARLGQIRFGTVESWLTYILSGQTDHITDVTNACRTMLMNIETRKWDDEMLSLFQIPKTCLPTIVPNIGHLSKTKGLSFLPDNIPIMALAGDQQAALFGQACFHKGQAKATFGTGCFILQNTGSKPLFSRHGLLTSIASELLDQPTYCLEGSTFMAGAAIDWLKDGLGMIERVEDVETLAQSVDSTDGVVFVPAFVGLGAPHWRADAKALFWGITRGTQKAHMARAVLMGIALQNAEVLWAMAEDGCPISELRIDGGASKNRLLMQMQADLLNVSCERPQTEEATVLGIGHMAGLALGLYPSLDFLKQNWRPQETFFPAMTESARREQLQLWRTAIAKA